MWRAKKTVLLMLLPPSAEERLMRRYAATTHQTKVSSRLRITRYDNNNQKQKRTSSSFLGLRRRITKSSASSFSQPARSASSKTTVDNETNGSITNDGAFISQPQISSETETTRTIVFIAEDELYSISLNTDDYVNSNSNNSKLRPHRLTTATGEVFAPLISKCGKFVVFAASEYFAMELYVVPIEGGQVKQMTFMGADFVRPVSFSNDGRELYFISSSQQKTQDETDVWALDLSHKEDGDESEYNTSTLPKAKHPKKLNLGPATAYEVNDETGLALYARNTQATAPWRRYRGGASGDVWIGSSTSAFVRVDPLNNFFTCISQPKWLNSSTIVFLAESIAGGVKGLWSYKVVNGDDGVAEQQEQTPKLLLEDAYMQTYCIEPSGACIYASRYGKMVYVNDLHKNAQTTTSSSTTSSNSNRHQLSFKWTGPRKQLERRYVTADTFIQNWDIDPGGRFMTTIVRGVVHSFGLWDGPALQYSPIKNDNKVFAESAAAAPAPKEEEEDARGSALLRKLMHETNAQARARFAKFTYDAERIVIVSDQTGEDDLEVHWEDNRRMPFRLKIPSSVLGRVEDIVCSPEAPLAAVINHRSELLIIDINTGETKIADKSGEDRGLYQMSWSPCGNWLAFTSRRNVEVSEIKILDVRTGECRSVTNPVLSDSNPSWDPDGRYLYFLSARELEPQYDAHSGGMNFPQTEKPYVLLLRKNVRDPHLKEIRAPGDESYTESFALGDIDIDLDDNKTEKGKKKTAAATSDVANNNDDDVDDKKSSKSSEKDEDGDEDDDDDANDEDETDSDKPPIPTEIHFDGITERAIALPLPLGRYSDLLALRHDRFMVVKYPTVSSGEVNLTNSEDDLDEQRGGALLLFDVRDLSAQVLVSSGVTDVHLSANRKVMVLEKSEKGYVSELKAYKAGSKPDDEESEDDFSYRSTYTRKSGSINLDRVRVLIDPKREWAQMLLEIWRRVRDDLFTDPLKLKDVNWKESLVSSVAVLPSINTRAEFATLVSDMLGELGFSHAYVSIGDDGRADLDRDHRPGFLGADFEWNDDFSGYEIKSIIKGDPWSLQNSGSLYRASANIKVGDVLGAINRVRLTPEVTPEMLLYETAGNEVLLSILKKDTGKLIATRTRAISRELDPRYRDFVERTTSYVHEKSYNKVGYLHLPDMERMGFSSFWRHYCTESINQRVLIIDLRGNGGGHISGLLLQTLTQNALALDVPRRGSPLIYPSRAPSGSIVAIVDENTGSDAELAAHAFQKLGIGKIVGERTWGGLLAVSRADSLLDGSVLSMPTQNVILRDDDGDDTDCVTNSIENRGVVPDVEVRRIPGNVDVQLNAAIEVALRLVEEKSSIMFGGKASKNNHSHHSSADEMNMGDKTPPWNFQTFAKFPPTLAEELLEKEAASTAAATKSNKKDTKDDDENGSEIKKTKSSSKSKKPVAAAVKKKSKAKISNVTIDDEHKSGDTINVSDDVS